MQRYGLPDRKEESPSFSGMWQELPVNRKASHKLKEASRCDECGLWPVFLLDGYLPISLCQVKGGDELRSSEIVNKIINPRHRVGASCRETELRRL